MKELIRYSRHIAIKEIGAGGVKKILNAKVFLTGIDEILRPLSLYLAGAGVLKIAILYSDEEIKNDIKELNSSCEVETMEELNVNGYDFVVWAGEYVDSALPIALSKKSIEYKIPFFAGVIEDSECFIIFIDPLNGGRFESAISFFYNKKNFYKVDNFDDKIALYYLTASLLSIEIIKKITNISSLTESTILRFNPLNGNIDKIKI